MTNAERFSIILSAIGIVGIPTLIFIVRATIKWTRVEDRLEMISNRLIDIVRDKIRCIGKCSHKCGKIVRLPIPVCDGLKNIFGKAIHDWFHSHFV